MSAQHTPGRFKVSYRYDNPHGSGPFKGSMVLPLQYKRGETIRAPFGAATVTSCRAIAKATGSAA